MLFRSAVGKQRHEHVGAGQAADVLDELARQHDHQACGEHPADQAAKGIQQEARHRHVSFAELQGSNPCLLHRLYQQVGTLPLVPHLWKITTMRDARKKGLVLSITMMTRLSILAEVLTWKLIEKTSQNPDDATLKSLDLSLLTIFDNSYMFPSLLSRDWTLQSASRNLFSRVEMGFMVILPVFFI